MIRGSAAVVILPNSVLVNVVFGRPTPPKPLICCVTPGPTRLNRLNASTRSSNCRLPEMLNFRLSAESTLHVPGPLNALRPRLPYVPGDGSEKTAVLKYMSFVGFATFQSPLM